MNRLTVVIPVYNEAATIIRIIDKVEKQNVFQIIIVDDASTDMTVSLIRKCMEHYHNITLVCLAENSGKGKALRTGFALAEGDMVIVQDADLEYDPEDYTKIMSAFDNPEIACVYGSRFLKEGKNTLFRRRKRVNSIMTAITNIIAGSQLTDVHTCYKAFRTSVIQAINLQENRFGFCTEVTLKALSAGYQIVEVPIRYIPRTVDEGKKLSIKDGIRSLWCNIKYGLLK